MASVAPPETHSQGVLRPGRDPWLCPKPLTEWPRASILRCCIVLPTQRPGLVRPSGGGRLACWPVPVGSTAVWALTFLSRWGAGPQRPWGFRRRARGRGQVPLHSLTRASELLSEACYPTCLQEPRASLSISPRPRHPLACPLSLRGAAWPLPWLHAAQLGGSPSLRRCGLGPPGAAVLVPGTQPLPAPCPGEGPPWPCRGVTVPQLCPEGDSLFPAGAVGWVPVFRSTRGRAAPRCLGLGHGGCWVCGGAVAGPACHSQAPSLPPCSRCTTSPPTPGSTMRTSKCEYVRPRADARGRGRALGSRSLGAGGRPGGSVDQSSGQAEPSWGQSGLGWEGWGGGPVTLRETGLRWGGRARTPHTCGPRDEEGGQESSLCVRGSPWAQGGGVAPGRAGGLWSGPWPRPVWGHPVGCSTAARCRAAGSTPRAPRLWRPLKPRCWGLPRTGTAGGQIPAVGRVHSVGRAGVAGLPGLDEAGGFVSSSWARGTVALAVRGWEGCVRTLLGVHKGEPSTIG